MKITNVHPQWGSIVEVDRDEFFSRDFDYWRNFIYERRFLVFKKMDFSKEDYVRFTYRFGNPWKIHEYAYSREGSEVVIINNQRYCLSPFSNILSKRLQNSEMPWHADIPNRDVNPFPFRSLWITKNPFPHISGKTSWLDLDLSLEYLTEEMKNLIPKVTVMQQSWYKPGTDFKEFPLLKVHPITGRPSLRLNYFNDPDVGRLDAWITGVKINGVLQRDCSLIEEWLKYLEKIQNLVYTHQWDTYDIAIYDNWSYVHKRTVIIPGPDGERHFYRVNMDHVPNNDWPDHAKEYASI